MTLFTMIGMGLPGTVVTFGAAALAAGALIGGLLLVTTAILIASGRTVGGLTPPLVTGSVSSRSSRPSRRDNR